ncbi:MAG: hypothetical protein II072_04710 [Clostridia bacterium]|jgi:hypothetical protein|nr:hypothetical protein [Clostridia bacterium]
MNEFLKALAKYSIVFAVLLVFLLFGLGTALLTAPNYLSGFLRYACVAFCFLPGVILAAGMTFFLIRESTGKNS